MARLSGIRTHRCANRSTYNGDMNTPPVSPVVSRCLSALGCLVAALWLTACSSTQTFNEGVDKRIERMQHEDDRSRIQELRVGGQTESIDVQPKNGAPAYQVGPSQNSPSPQEGRSFWRLFEF
jgi:hypothetical protein